MLNDRLFRLTVIVLLLTIPLGPNSRADEAHGKKIYALQCASCHGSQGQGETDEYQPALSGEHSIEALAGIITRTMPEENPEACVAQDALDVAEYMYHEFYAPSSRRRTAQARVELVRLTANQHRSALADLMGDAVTGRIHLTGKQGIPAKYYNARNTRKDQLVLERTDPTIDFDFGSLGELVETEYFTLKSLMIFKDQVLLVTVFSD